MYFKQAFDFIDQTLFGDTSSWQDLSDLAAANDSFDNCKEFEHTDNETQTLKLDLVKGTVEEWDVCPTKRISLSCDLETKRLRKFCPQNKILVHCAMGKSRSATIVTMYLMKKFNITYKVARNMVKMRRETVEINDGFISQLKTFEQNYLEFAAALVNEDSDSTEGEESLVSCPS